jgi:hypothetical protein
MKLIVIDTETKGKTIYNDVKKIIQNSNYYEIYTLRGETSFSNKNKKIEIEIEEW